MRIDLEQALHDMASSVHDEVTADRMAGQVRHMVARVRRRRAARRTSQGVVGLGAASALVLAGAHLEQHVGLVTGPQHGQAAAPPGHDGDPFGTCGGEVEALGGLDGVLGDGRPGQDDDASEAGDDGPATESGAAGQVRDTAGTAAGADTLAAGDADAVADLPAPALSVSATVESGGGRALVEVRADYDVGDLGPLTEQDPVAVVTADGVVVAPVGRTTRVLESSPAVHVIEQELVSCQDGSPLPAGTYELHVRQELGRADGSVLEVSGGPVELVLPEGAPDDAADPEATEDEAGPEGSSRDRPGTDDVVDDDGTADDDTARDDTDEAARRALAAALATEDPGVFPACGARLPQAPSDPLLTMTLREPANGLGMAPGSVGEVAVDLRTHGDRTVLMNAAPYGTLLFLVDDVVVGYRSMDPDDLHLLQLTPGDAGTLRIRWTAHVCNPDGSVERSELPLPAGRYTAVAAYDFLVKEVVERDGTARAVTEPLTVLTPPVQVTVR